MATTAQTIVVINTMIVLKEFAHFKLKNFVKQKYVKTHEKGIQIKNNHSSIGKPKILQPITYVSLNHQTPIFVNQTSHKINGTATNELDFKKVKKY